MDPNQQAGGAAPKEDYVDKGMLGSVSIHCKNNTLTRSQPWTLARRRPVRTQPRCAPPTRRSYVAIPLTSICTHMLTMDLQTDKARGMFEKATGKNVPDKVSN